MVMKMKENIDEWIKWKKKKYFRISNQECKEMKESVNKNVWKNDKRKPKKWGKGVTKQEWI